MDNLDFKLKLLTGKSVHTDGFDIRPKTIGEIVEVGNHQELMAKHGLYAHLHDIQFKTAQLQRG